MKHHFLGAISLALGLTIASCEPAHAEDCMAKDSWVQTVSRDSTGITIDQVADIPAAELQKMIEIYNATPPIGKPITADAGVLLWGKSTSTGQRLDTALVGLFSNGCRIASLIIPAPGAPQAEDDPA